MFTKSSQNGEKSFGGRLFAGREQGKQSQRGKQDT